MRQKKKLVKSYIFSELAERLRATSEREGISESSFVGMMIERVVGPEEAAMRMPTKALREGKVTVRLS